MRGDANRVGIGDGRDGAVGTCPECGESTIGEKVFYDDMNVAFHARYCFFRSQNKPRHIGHDYLDDSRRSDEVMRRLRENR